MRKHHLSLLTKTPVQAQQDPLILKLEGLTAWIDIFLLIPTTSLWKEFVFPDDTGTGTGTDTGF